MNGRVDVEPELLQRKGRGRVERMFELGEEGLIVLSKCVKNEILEEVGINAYTEHLTYGST